jgi:Skp family chaperone for outer membrane proteins
MTIAVALCALTLAGRAYAQTAPPPTQPPPATQTPPPAGQKPPAPTTAPAVPKPAPVPFPPDAKIGFVNMQTLVNESTLGKQGQAELKRLRDKLGTPIAAKQKELIGLQEKIQSQANLVSEAVLSGMGRELERGKRELQSMQENLDIETNDLQGNLIASFSAKVQPIVEAIRNEKGLWAVWVATADSGLYAVHPGLDLTPEVQKRLDALPIK